MIVSGHGSFQFVVADNGFCDLTSGASLNNTAGIVGTGNNSFSPFALTKAFAVSKGSNTFNLVCNSGANGTTNMIRAGMTAIFFPTRY